MKKIFLIFALMTMGLLTYSQTNVVDVRKNYTMPAFQGNTTVADTLQAKDLFIVDTVMASGSITYIKNVIEVFDNNGDNPKTVVTLLNNDEQTTGETSQTVDIEFEVKGTVDGGTNYTDEEAVKLSVYKIGDYFTAGGQADNDAGLKISTVTDGSYVLNTTFSDNDMDIVDNLTVGDIIVDEASGVISGTGATLFTLTSVADIEITTTSNNEDIKLIPDGSGDVLITSAGLVMTATEKIYLDGEGDTYIDEPSADIFSVSVGGVVGALKIIEAGSMADVRIQKQVVDFEIVNTTSLGEMQFFGDDNTANADEIAGQIEVISTGTWTDGAEDAKMVLNVANNGTLNANQIVLNTDGTVSFGGGILTGDITISDATPILQYKDTDCAVADVNASIQADATTTTDGSEDIDVTFMFQVNGTPTNYLVADADDDITITSTDDIQLTATGGEIIANDDLHIGADDAAENLIIHDAGIMTFYDLSDDSQVTLQISGDGTTMLDLTGSLDVTAEVEAEQLTSTDDALIKDALTIGDDVNNTSGTLNFIASDGDAGSFTIGTSDDFAVTGFTGGFDIDGDCTVGTLSSDAGLSGTTLGLTAGITQAPTATGNLYDLQLENEWTTGIVMIGNFGSATTLSGDISGIYLDFESNVTCVNKDINGFYIKTPAQTNTSDDANVLNGFSVSGGALDMSGGAGSTIWKGLNVEMPDITETAATVNSYGFYIDGGTVTSGTEYGIYVNSADVYFDGTITGTGKISTLLTTEQLRLSFDAINYATWTVEADGALTLVTVDAGAAEGDINFNPDGYVGIKTVVPTVELDVTGAIKASGTMSAATYGSDGSITDAELLVFDDGAITEILVGGGAGSAPVWTTATGTGAPARAGSPTFTTKLTVPEIENTGNITLDPTGAGATYVDIANSGAGAAKLYIEGSQVDSDDLSDVASIAMLDENESITGAWLFTNTTTAITVGNASAGVDYRILFDGETNDGTLTYMEDEDRFDFDNDVDVIADLTAGTITSDATVKATTMLGCVTQQTTTLSAGVVTFTITSNVVQLTGDGGANIIATISGAIPGIYTIIFTDGNITISNDDTHNANTIDLDGANDFTSADDKVLQLVFNGTSWYRVGESIN